MTPSGSERRGRRTFLRAMATVGLAGLPALAALGRPAAAASPLRAVVISDLNESYGSLRYSSDVQAAVRRIVQLRPDIVLSTGDMVAGQRLEPAFARREIEAMWTAFHHAVSEPLARAGLPLLVTPGNHDASSGVRFALERAIFREQWLPRRPSVDFVDGDAYPFCYAVGMGRVLFVSLDVTYVGPIAERDKRWLDGVLARHGSAFQHRVVFSHIPLWPFTHGRENDFSGDDELEGILRQRGVDLHLSGHHHAYYPGWKDGVRFVSQACLGAARRPLLGSAKPGERAITVIDFELDGAVAVEAYRAPGFVERIARKSLPERVVSRRAVLVRDDLASAGTSAAPRGSDVRVRAVPGLN